MEQAREYWQRVDRPNLMIKIPGTDEGAPAIEEMIYEGLNINVTLLFSVAAYERVAEAFIRGLERRLEEGKSVDMQSVASFFVSRVDSEVDKRLEAAGHTELRGPRGPRERARRLPALQGDLPRRALRRAARGGRVGPAAAVGVDRREEPEVPGHDVRRRARRRPRRSTRCRWRRCSPPPTTRTIEGATVEIDPEPDLRALAEAGHRPRRGHREAARRRHRRSSSSRWTSCSRASTTKREAIVTSRPPTIQADDPRRPRAARSRSASRKATVEDVAHRIWKKDETLWGPAGQAEIANRLGWLTIADTMREAVDDLEAFAAEMPRRGLHGRRAARHGRLVARARGDPPSFGDREGWPALHVLDSTDAGAIRARRATAIDLEQDALPRLDEVGRDDRDAVAVQVLLGAAGPTAAQFVAITDPGSGAREARRASTASAARSSTTPTSAGATARCRTSASCRRR